MKIPILSSPERHWECPNCEWKLVTRDTQTAKRLHPCRGLKGLYAPLVLAGTRCEVKAVEREDYVGKETVTYDGENRPIMRIETTRDDGNDVAVLAPCATLSVRME